MFVDSVGNVYVGSSTKPVLDSSGKATMLVNSSGVSVVRKVDVEDIK